MWFLRAWALGLWGGGLGVVGPPLGTSWSQEAPKGVQWWFVGLPRGSVWGSFWHQNRKRPEKGLPEGRFGRIPERSRKNVDFGSPPDVPNHGFPLLKQTFLKVHRAAKKHGKVAHLGGIWTPLGTVGAKNAEKGWKKDEPETRPKKGGEKVTRV